MAEHLDKASMTEILRKVLLTTPHSKPVSGDTEIAVRCPFCGDSKSSNNPHLYINMVKDGHPYDCKRCPSKSEVLTRDVLTMLGLVEINLFEYLKTFENVTVKKTINIDDRFSKLNVTVPTTVLKRDQWKIDKYSDRMKTDMSLKKNIERFRIITNLTKFMEVNDLPMPNDPDKRREIKVLTDHYMGFLSVFNNKIAFDLVDDYDGERKMIHSLSDKVNAPFLYMINHGIDPLSPNPKIVMGEGCSDAIGPSLLYYTRDNHNVVFAACGSQGAYKNAVKTVLALTCFMGCDLEIYSDDNVPVSQYDTMLRGISGSFESINIIFNKKSKDFGDMTKPIDPKIMKLR